MEVDELVPLDGPRICGKCGHPVWFTGEAGWADHVANCEGPPVWWPLGEGWRIP